MRRKVVRSVPESCKFSRALALVRLVSWRSWRRMVREEGFEKGDPATVGGERV